MMVLRNAQPFHNTACEGLILFLVRMLWVYEMVRPSFFATSAMVMNPGGGCESWRRRLSSE